MTEHSHVWLCNLSQEARDSPLFTRTFVSERVLVDVKGIELHGFTYHHSSILISTQPA